MPMETVTVAGKSDPEMGKKRGRIKSDSGMIFQADPSILAAIVVGSKYEVVYKDEAFKDFKYRVVESINPAMMNNRGQMQPSRRQVAQAAEPYVPSETNYTRDELIFVEAFGKSWIEKCALVNKEVIGSIVDDLRYIWRIKFAKSKIETGVDPDFNDEIPEFPGDR